MLTEISGPASLPASPSFIEVAPDVSEAEIFFPDSESFFGSDAKCPGKKLAYCGEHFGLTTTLAPLAMASLLYCLIKEGLSIREGLKE